MPAGAAAEPFGHWAAAVPASAAPAGTPQPGGPNGPASTGSGRPPGSGGKPPRALIITLIAVVCVAVLAGLFILGTKLPALLGTAPTPTPAATEGTAPATEAPTPPPAPTAMQPAGEHNWDELFGGECLDPFVSPWAETFTVVDCGAPHAAQLAFRGSLGGDEATPFPGEEAIAAQTNELCGRTGIVDPAAESAAGQLQMQSSFPVTEQQWAAGQRNYYCFVSAVSGEPLTASVTGPGPAA
ncbi:hypothetical protein GY24_15665 [Microterricola pindariensis]|uniref:Septum formation-related domain-containing protein n=2 Tax=Microterricola pindariensis TaxID=478010 RepID=A0ABX5ARS9_9MICO|nr:hypothetical protein GY24_15665 [Microterricola pindariensis]